MYLVVLQDVPTPVVKPVAAAAPSAATEERHSPVTVNTQIDDMNNLLAGTGIGTVLVDQQLLILRFTPTASAIINLIPTDVGRPVAHIALNLVGYKTLIPDVQSVLDTLVSKEKEVRTSVGKLYTMRISPYRTIANRIEGAVITFVDITEINRMRELIRLSGQSRRSITLSDYESDGTRQPRYPAEVLPCHRRTTH